MPMPLHDQICYTLYATSMAVTRVYKPLLDTMGLTYPQYLVLTVLGEEDGATVGGIAGHLALEASTITPMVKRLEQAGLVNRRRSTVDERQVEVWLTPEGRARVADSGCLRDTLIARSGMPESAIVQLNRQIQALRDALVGSAEADQAAAD